MVNHKSLGILFIVLVTSISLTSQDIQDLTLEDLLDVEINTAAKYDQKIDDVPAPVHIVTAEQIAQHGYQTLEDVLNTVPGFYSTYDRNYNYTGVRGFSRPSDYSNRVLLLLDGHKINEVYYGSMDAGRLYAGINLKSIQRIEIIQGPGSVLYGTGAMFAVINLVSKKGNEVNGLQLGMNMGSFGHLGADFTYGKEYQSGLNVSLAGALGKIKGQDLYFAEFDDPATSNGIAEDADKEDYQGLRFAVSYGGLNVQGMYTARRKAIPTAAWDMIFNDGRAESFDTFGFFEILYAYELQADKTITSRVYYDDYYYEGIYPYEEVEEGAPYAYVWKEKTATRSTGIESRLLWDTGSNNRFIMGFEYQMAPKLYFKEWDEWGSGFDANNEFTVLSVFSQDEYQITSNLAFTGGLRYDDYSNMGGFITPRLAAIYNFSKTATMKALHGVAFRTPTTYERYYEDLSYGYKNNPDLIQEMITSTDLVYLNRMTPSLLFSAAIFHYNMEGVITQTIDPTDGNIVHKNGERVASSGIELILQRKGAQKLPGYLSYSLNHSRELDLDEKLSNSPSILIKAGTHFQLLDKFEIALDLRYETPRRTVYFKRSKSVFLGDLALSSSGLHNRIKISVKVKNLFDVQYGHPASWEHRQHFIPQDGRSIQVGLNYNFSIGS